MQEHFEFSSGLRERLKTYFVLRDGVTLTPEQLKESLRSLVDYHQALHNDADSQPPRHTELRNDENAHSSENCMRVESL